MYSCIPRVVGLIVSSQRVASHPATANLRDETPRRGRPRRTTLAGGLRGIAVPSWAFVTSACSPTAGDARRFLVLPIVIKGVVIITSVVAISCRGY
jgi:hypothetical protein